MNRNRSEYRANVALHAGVQRFDNATMAARQNIITRANDEAARRHREWAALERFERKQAAKQRREARARLAWWVIGAAILPTIFFIATN